MNSSPVTPALMTVSQAAAYLGLNRSTLGEMIRMGEVPFIPWRGSKLHKRLSRASLDKWIAARLVHANPQNAGALLRATDGRTNFKRTETR